MIFFTADEHYDHKNIIKYCNRPFATVAEMDATIIANNNEVVTEKDVVVHAGDFMLSNKKDAAVKYISLLRGAHIFLRGSHDGWLKHYNKKAQSIYETKVDGQVIIVCHYAMRTWPKAHYGSWQLYGHSHGKLPDIGLKQMDVGVDAHDFYPVSFTQVKGYMEAYGKTQVRHTGDTK